MDQLTEALASLLDQCIDRGMQLPFVTVVVAPNGSVMAGRYTGSAHMPLTTHVEDPGFRLPINIIIADQTGEAARMTITQDGTTYH